jgi:hypothetical protein
MIFINTVLVFFSVLTLILFIKASLKKYSDFRRVEAARYFNGSLVKENDVFVKERSHTFGLTLSKNELGQMVFRKLSKICDKGLLYD